MMPSTMGYHREPPSLGLPPRVDTTGAPARLVLVIGGRQGERALADCLAQRGLRCIFEPRSEQLAALQDQVAFDAVVVNVSAGSDAMAATLARVRQHYAGRVLVVSDSDDEIDEIMALELGADDFVRAPVSPRRLRARLLALLRTARGAATPAGVPATPEPAAAAALGGWHLDTVHLRLERGGRFIALTTTQVQLLQCLQRHAGRLVPRAELHERVCPGASDIRARTIDVYVHRLRRRLLDEGVHEIRIEAVRGRGFVLQVDAAGGTAPPGPAVLRAVT